MRKLITSIALLLTACLNVQCQKAEIHMNDGTTVEIPVEDIDSITFSMTNPFNFETHTVKLNSGYEIPIIGIGTYLLSTAQAEESVYNALKVGMRLIDTADIYGNEVGVGRGIRRAMQDFGIKREEIFVTSKLWTSSFNNADYEVDERLERLGLDYIDLLLLHHTAAYDEEAYQVILRWHLQCGTIAIPGSSNAAHIAEDYDIFDFELTPDEMQRINALECNHRFASY